MKRIIHIPQEERRIRELVEKALDLIKESFDPSDYERCCGNLKGIGYKAIRDSTSAAKPENWYIWLNKCTVWDYQLDPPIMAAILAHELVHDLYPDLRERDEWVGKKGLPIDAARKERDEVTRRRGPCVRSTLPLSPYREESYVKVTPKRSGCIYEHTCPEEDCH